MCGIVGYIGKDRAVPVLINGLLSLEYRGYDSAGVAVLEPNQKNSLINDKLDGEFKNYFIKVVKDKGRVKNLESNSELSTIVGSVGIAHTRWATHGVPSKVNSHPHLDNSGNFAVVHNGIIENYLEIRKKLMDNGYELVSDTDTEVIPNLIHFYYDGDILEAISKAVKELKGSFAIEVITPYFPDKLFVAKKDSPLVIGVGKSENYVASDIPAILSYTNDFYFLDESEIGVISKDDVKFYDFNLNELSKDIKNIEWDAVKAQKGGFEDFMLKEIYEQPDAVRETIGSRLEVLENISNKDTSNDRKADLNNVKLGNVKLLEDIDFSKFNKIFIVACGTAMHAGIAAKYAFEKFCKIPCEVDMASEFRYREPLVDDKTLCIFVSQSGETADTIAALKLAKSYGATAISVVNVIGSSITRLSDYTIYTHAGPEIAVASTKAYTCQVTLLCLLATAIAESLGNSSNELDEFKVSLISLPDKIKEALKTANSIKSYAEKVYLQKDLYFVGRCSDYATTLEGSLKLKEISYIHSEAYASGELKHGPIALIEENTPVIGVATNPAITEKTLSNLEEAITRGASVMLVTNQDISNDKLDMVVKVPTVHPLLSPIVSVVPLQLFAYYISKFKSLDVDKPRNLAKSVTVE